MPEWKSSASQDALSQRAQLYRFLRLFFEERGVMEVDVPVLARTAASDPHIDSMMTFASGETLYLQSSPECFLKRLLASGSGNVYSLGKAFRNGEAGRKHNPEFTMLEWYRLGWTEQELMDEVATLIGSCLDLSRVEKLSYQELFERELKVNPHTASVMHLKTLTQQHIDVQLDGNDRGFWDRDVWLDLLMSHVLEPRMGDGLVLLYDFPKSQAALARLGVDEQQQTVAKRFEAYVGGVELANGYWELCDAQEQRQRLQQDLAKRQVMDCPQYPLDTHLLDALQSGLPDCAGVALGVDRLLMLVMGCSDIRELLAFPFERV